MVAETINQQPVIMPEYTNLADFRGDSSGSGSGPYQVGINSMINGGTFDTMINQTGSLNQLQQKKVLKNSYEETKRSYGMSDPDPCANLTAARRKHSAQQNLLQTSGSSMASSVFK